jgi:hypothetical protein
MSRSVPFLLGLVWLAVSVGVADEPLVPPPTPAIYVPPKGYVCYRAAKPITIDGKLDDAAWKDAPWSDYFADIEGGLRPAPRYHTRVKMLWDDRCLYIGAELEEPHVRATLREHDSVIFRDNDFEVFLNPEGDGHLYAELELNALNTTWDLLLPKPYKDKGKGIDAWEIAGLRTAVHVDGTLNDPSDVDRGWTVEIAWPWKGLAELTHRAVPPRDGDAWRINFSRVEWEHTIQDGKYRNVEGKPEANWAWSPQGVIDMHRPEQWGYVQFSTAPPGTAKFHPDPTGPARHLLHRIYYAQMAYRKKHGAFARSLTDLGLDGLTAPNIEGASRLETAGGMFEASVRLKDGRRCVIRQDSRTTVEE